MTEPTIEFPEGYFDRREDETPSKGWLDVVVHFRLQRYRVSFYDATRARQSLEDQVQMGHVHFAEPGFVLLTEVNTANVRRAVHELAREGFFDRLAPEKIVDRQVTLDSRASPRQWAAAVN